MGDEGRQRLAIAFGHLGGSFHGSQFQPDVVTVQGEIESTLRDLTWVEDDESHPLRLSSRTDAGVNVRMNLATFDLDSELWDRVGPPRVLKALNDRLPDDLLVWAAMPTHSDLNIREASSREYLYRLQALPGWPCDTPEERLAHWCRLFEGGHDLSNFCRVEKDRSTLRTIDSCEPWMDAEGVVLGFRIVARSFLWNQVRRIASCLHGLARERLDTAAVLRALHRPQERVDHGLAPADWLVLWRIDHPEVPLGIGTDSVDDSAWSKPPRGDERLHERWQVAARAEMSMALHRGWISALTPNEK